MSKHRIGTREDRPTACERMLAGENEHLGPGDEPLRQRLDAIVDALWGSELLLDWTDAQPRATD